MKNLNDFCEKTKIRTDKDGLRLESDIEIKNWMEI